MRRELLSPVMVLLLPLSAAQFFVERLETTSLGEPANVGSCNATGANFGQDVAYLASPENIGCIEQTEPRDACSRVHILATNRSECKYIFALVPRGVCSFSEKAFHSQNATYDALIVTNYPGPPIRIAGGRLADHVKIPVLMVGRACMDNLIGNSAESMQYLFKIRASPEYYEAIKPKLSTAIKRYATHLVAGGLVVLLLFTLLITCLLRRRLARRRTWMPNLEKVNYKKRGMSIGQHSTMLTS